MIKKFIILFLMFLYTPYVKNLYNRALHTEIGTVGGVVTLDDELFNMQRRIKKLDWFERWLISDWIKQCKAHHQLAYQLSTYKPKED